MINKFLLLHLTAIFLACQAAFSQPAKSNPYNLLIVSSAEAYRGECSRSSENRLEDLGRSIPSVQLDIRYATPENFTGKPVYTSARAFLRKPAADALAAVQAELLKEGLGLKVYDAYRPYAATLLFYELVGDTLFVASPVKGSRHNRGCAVDVTLVDHATGAELEMPTGYDDFSEKANPGYMDLPPAAIANRARLKEVMRRHGFIVFPSEWWHFDFNGWERFSLMDLSFEELQ